MKNNLSILPQYINRQISASICRETGSIAQQRVFYLFLPVGTINTIADRTDTIMIGINLTSREYPNIPASCPGYHSAYIGQNPPMVSYTGIASGKEEISLRIDIHQNIPAPFSKQLSNHFPDSPFYSPAVQSYTY
jgi:hypothetical protein